MLARPSQMGMFLSVSPPPGRFAPLAFGAGVAAEAAFVPRAKLVVSRELRYSSSETMKKREKCENVVKKMVWFSLGFVRQGLAEGFDDELRSVRLTQRLQRRGQLQKIIS